MSVKKSYAGAAPELSLVGGIGSTDGSFVAATGGIATGWPDGSAGSFIALLGGGEKVLCSSRSGTTFTVALGGRGYDGTTAAAWPSGTTTKHTLDAESLENFSLHMFDPTRDDHTQYPFVFSAKAYGAKGNNSTDDTAAIQAAIDACATAGGGIVYLDAGSYVVSPGANIYCLSLGANVTLKGAGTWSSVLVDNAQHTGAPYTIQAQSVDNVAVEDLSVLGNADPTDLASGGQGFAVAFLSVNHFRLSNFQATNMRVGPFTIGRENALDKCTEGNLDNLWCFGGRMNLGYLACCDDVNVSNVYGESREGFCIEGGPCNRINLSNIVAKSTSVSTGLGFGIEILANWGNLTAISVSNVQVIGNFLDGMRAYANHNGGSFFSITDLSVTNVHCNGNNQAGSTHGFGFVCDAGCVFDGLQVTNCSARNYAQGQGFRFDGPFLAEVANCLSASNFNQGYAIINGAEIRFNQCRALENNQTNAGGNAGFYLDVSSIAHLTGCKASSSKTGYGVQAITTGTNVVYATDCDFTGNTTAATNIATGASVLRNCAGFNPIGHGVTQPSVPLSTVAVTNTTKADCTVFVNGGTVSVVAIGGNNTGQTSGPFRVPAGQTITLTYTVAPTWVWFGD